MQLLMLTDALRRLNPAAPVHLDMPYVPYARQDRICNPGEALGAAVFCKLINDQQYATVSVVEPHSDVTPPAATRPRHRRRRLPEERAGQPRLCQRRHPDGARRRRPQARAGPGQKLGVADVRYAEKVRDPQTGRITETRVPDDIPAQPVLVVDDICDGGRTFLELAAALRDKTDQPLYLYVTHGIFSKGLAELNARYAGLYTAYDWTAAEGPGAPVIVNPIEAADALATAAN